MAQMGNEAPGELLESGGKPIGVTMSLRDSPCFEGVQPDAFKIARRCRG
jgi:hypothetical protein